MLHAGAFTHTKLMSPESMQGFLPADVVEATQRRKGKGMLKIY